MFHVQVHRYMKPHLSKVFLSLLATSLFYLGDVLSDECINYSNITDPTRSISNAADGGCDDTTFDGTSWVRFTGSGGTFIAEHAPLSHHCGANAVGWIQGGHPAVADGIVERQLCFHHSGDICLNVFNYKISIRNCGTFYVYKPPDITQCSLRICTDSLDSCFYGAVGVANPSIIPDNQMTATSYYANNINYQPAYGRLHGNRGDGWCTAQARSIDDWLQVDFGRMFQVCAVATQGDHNYDPFDEWVTHFKLSFSLDGSSWTTYTDGNGVEVEFHRLGDSDTVDKHKLPVPVSARYIRFHPTQQKDWNCLRVEVYGIADIDECAANTHDCDVSATCTNTPGSFTCACNAGYTGDGKSCQDIDECVANSHDCHVSATCTNTVGSFTCSCYERYSGNGKSCSDINECTANSDDCHLMATCTNTEGSFTCACNAGYIGDGQSCNDIDECSTSSNDCHLLATCTNTDGSFTCACNEGYTGDGKLCSDVDECETGIHNCHPLGVCSNTFGSFTCHCQRGYTGNGTFCEACPEYSRCIQTSPIYCECWCKYFYPGNPELDPCKPQDDSLDNLPAVVTIHETESQPDSPIKLRRDQRRTLASSFNLGSSNTLGQVTFYWRIQHLMMSPFNISDEPELLVHDTLELYIGPKLLSTGLKLVVFELRITEAELAARDFAFLEVQKSALIATIVGGTELIRSLTKPIPVDASSSYDPENENETSLGMSFNWTCFIVANRNSSGVNGTMTSFSVNGSDNVPNTLAGSTANDTLFQLKNDVFLHSFQKGKVELDTGKLKNNETYYVVLTVHKDSRVASAFQALHIHDEELVDIRIMCFLNCRSPAKTSSLFSARTDCTTTRCPYTLTYRWKMFIKNGSHPYSKWVPQTNFSILLATKEDSKNLVIKQHKLEPGSSYRVTVDVLLPNGSYGLAAYQFYTLEAPSGGTCHGTQLDQEAIIGVWLNITCHGWRDVNLPLKYEFYGESKDGAFDMFSYGVMPYSLVHVSPSAGEDVVRFKVSIVNVVGIASEVQLSIKVNQSSLSLTQNEELLYVQIKETLTAMDNNYTLGQINMAIQEADSLLALLKAADGWIDEAFLLQTKDHVISRICNVRVDTSERLIQIASILGKYTEDAANVVPNTTFVVLDKLMEMTVLLSQTTEHRSETRLIANAGRSLLHCNTNIMKYTALKILTATNSTNNDQENEVIIWKTISGLCQSLAEKITNTLLSLKVPGEEYTVIKNKHQSIILRKHESHELSQLTIQYGNVTFELPTLDDKVLKAMLGDMSEVGVVMMKFNFNPYTSHSSSQRVRSKVVSLALKDDNGDALVVKDLPSDIQINIPISEHDPGNTSRPARTDYFLNPGSMQYHEVSAREVNTTLKFSITLKTAASITAYIKYGEHPTETSFDDVLELSEKSAVKNLLSRCTLTGKCSYDIVMNCNITGKYYIGLLGNNKNQTSHSRGRRSILSAGAPQEKCVKFKDPPPTVPTPADYTILVPVYDPNISVNYSLEVNTIWCAYWSDSEERWTNEGCKVGQASNSSSLTCLCNHLTAFGGDVLVAPNTINFDMVQQAFDNLDPKTLLVLITVCSVFLVYFIVLVFARRADKLDALKDSPVIPLVDHQSGEYKYDVSITTGAWKNSGTTAEVSIILHGTDNTSGVIKLTRDHLIDRILFAQGNTDNFLVHLDKPLGTITSVQIGHDSSGDDPSWFLSEVLIVDNQTSERWMFSCFRWLALERDDGSTSAVFYTDGYKDEDQFKRNFSALRMNGFSDDHLWFSIIRKQPRNPFTRVQRASCCWCLLMLSMVTSAMFYETESTTQQKIKIGPFELTPSQLIIALESAMIVVPASVLIVFLFRKSEPKMNTQGRRYHLAKAEARQQFKLPHFCVYIAWFLCVSTAITSALFTVFYSLMWGGEKSARWLTTVLLSLSGEVIISQPIKIMLVSVIIASRCGCGKKTARESISAEEQKLERLHTAVNLDVERARKYKINERKMYAYMKELVFSLLFFALLLIVCYGDKNEHRYNLNAATESDFQYSEKKVKNVTQFWGWLKNTFVPEIFTADTYNDQEEEASDYIGNNRSILIGMPRLRQLRVMTNSCEVHELLKNMIKSCHDFYSIKEEEKTNWIDTNKLNSSSILCPENWEYTKDRKPGVFDSWGRFAFYSGSGFVANLGYNKLTAKRIIDDLMKHHWIDRQTRAVFVEFSVYNPSSNLLAVMSYNYEVLPSGFSGTFKSYGILPLSATDSQAHNTYLLFAFIFGLLLVCYFVMECIKLCRQKCSYFKSVWNWLNMLQILTASSALMLQWMRSKVAAKSFAKLKENPFVPISFHQALFLFEAENIAICVTSVIATLRLLKCFYFNPQVIIFSCTIRRSFSSVSSFFLIFTVVAIAHALLAVIAFGDNVHAFSSVPEAIFTQFLMLLGSNIPVHELNNINPFLGRFFFFTFVSSTTVILGNMFVAIINDHYVSSCAVRGDDVELAEFIMDWILETLFGQKSKRTRGWKECTSHELYEPDELPVECSVGEHSNDALSPDHWTPVMYRSYLNRTEKPLVHNRDSAKEYAVWETFRPEELLVKSSADKKGFSSVNLNRLSSHNTHFKRHFIVTDWHESSDADDNDDDEECHDKDNDDDGDYDYYKDDDDIDVGDDDDDDDDDDDEDNKDNKDKVHKEPDDHDNDNNNDVIENNEEKVDTDDLDDDVKEEEFWKKLFSLFSLSHHDDDDDDEDDDDDYDYDDNNKNYVDDDDDYDYDDNDDNDDHDHDDHDDDDDNEDNKDKVHEEAHDDDAKEEEFWKKLFTLFSN